MIPLLKPSISKKEIENVTKVLKSGWWGLGPVTQEFEEKFAKYVGMKYSVGVNSASSALILALMAHEITDGEIIVPALTFVSTALAALYTGNKVVFADIEEKNLNIDWQDVNKKVTNETKAIIPVWYAGTKNINLKNSRYSGFEVIEDCAHAGGTKAKFNNTACWSFHAVKNLATGDGGMVTTNNEEVYKKLLALRWVGIDKSTWERSQKKYGWDYSIDSLGLKAHMNDLTAAIGLAQLERLDEMNEKRKRLALRYLEAFSGLSWLKSPIYDSNSSWHLFVVRTERRNEFIDYLLENEISAGVHYKPLNTYSIFPKTELAVTDRVWKTLVTLPLYPDLSEKEQDYIIKTIKNYEAT